MGWEKLSNEDISTIKKLFGEDCLEIIEKQDGDLSEKSGIYYKYNDAKLGVLKVEIARYNGAIHFYVPEWNSEYGYRIRLNSEDWSDEREERKKTIPSRAIRTKITVNLFEQWLFHAVSMYKYKVNKYNLFLKKWDEVRDEWNKTGGTWHYGTYPYRIENGKQPEKSKADGFTLDIGWASYTHDVGSYPKIEFYSYNIEPEDRRNFFLQLKDKISMPKPKESNVSEVK